MGRRVVEKVGRAVGEEEGREQTESRIGVEMRDRRRGSGKRLLELKWERKS